MTSAVARGDGLEKVFSKTGTGKKCAFPLTVATDQCSSRVFVEGIGVVRLGDKVAQHNFAGCYPDICVVNQASFRVFVEGRGLARIGDSALKDNIIMSGSSRVFSA